MTRHQKRLLIFWSAQGGSLNKSRSKETQQSVLSATQLKRCGMNWWAQVAEDGPEKQQRKVSCRRVWSGQWWGWDSQECQGNMEGVLQRVHGMELYRGSWTGKVGRGKSGKNRRGEPGRQWSRLSSTPPRGMSDAEESRMLPTKSHAACSWD